MDRDKGGAEDPVNGELVDRYRQASAELDEQPAASTRASILAAAARAVDSKPVDAAAKPRTRARWPLAAAAAVMLSTLAVMLAIRTNEEMPHFGAPPETARSAADAVAPSAKPARSAADAGAPSAAPASTPPTVDLAPRQREESQERVTEKTEKRQVQTGNERAARANKESDSVAQAPRETSPPKLAEARGKKDSDSVPQAPREADRPAPAAAPAPPPVTALEKARQDVPAATPAPPAPEPTDRAKQRAEQPAAGAVAPPAPMDQASAGARRDMGRIATPPLSAAQSERKQVEESAAAWLERIIKLRREGRHDEADAELKRFRERYPQVQPPSEALGPVQPPAGTR
jgi:hypothetical protein